MFQQPGSADNIGWAFMFGITAILGAWGAGTLGQSDWTRYANRKFAPTLSQMVAAPITIAVTATIGIIVTSAARDVLGGDIIWNPIYLLADIQDAYGSSPRSRAGVFFASIGLVSSQLAVSDGPGLSGVLMLTRATDLRCPQLGIDRHGHGGALAQVYQHPTRQLYHGMHRHRCPTVAAFEHSRQIPQGAQWVWSVHGTCYVSLPLFCPFVPLTNVSTHQRRHAG